MSPALLASVALALLLYGLVSGRAERTVLTAPIVFVALGWVLGDDGFGWLMADEEIIHGLAELTLVLVLFTDASRIDLGCLRREESLPMRMLAIGLPLTIVLGTAAAVAVFPGIGIFEALLLAAVLAPTDAALGQAVVSSPYVPVRIRQTLNVESGLNDGVALPVVLIAASLVRAMDSQAGIWDWVQFTAMQVTLGPLAGVAVGWAGGRLVDTAMVRGWVNEAFSYVSVLGLAGLAFGAAELVGGNGFIAAFVAGLTLGNVTRHLCTHLVDFGEAEGQLFTLLVFMMFAGNLLPEVVDDWDGRTWLYAILSLTLVRMVPTSLCLLGTGLRPTSHVFLGWFGPRGLASILFGLLTVGGDGYPDAEWIFPVVLLTVLLSVFAHGMTAYPAARRYGSEMEELTETCPERAAVEEQPVRIRHSYEA